MCYVLKILQANWQKWHPEAFGLELLLNMYKRSFTHTNRSAQAFSYPSSCAGEDDLPPATFRGPSKNFATPSKDEAAFAVTEELTDHWIRCNVYTMTKTNTKSTVLRLYNFIAFTNNTMARRTESGGSGWWTNLSRTWRRNLTYGRGSKEEVQVSTVLVVGRSAGW